MYSDLKITSEQKQARVPMYSRERFTEAVQLWEEALKSLPDFDVLLRNLGLAAWQREGDLQKARQPAQGRDYWAPA